MEKEESIVIPLNEMESWDQSNKEEFSRLVNDRQMWNMAESLAWCPTGLLSDTLEKVLVLRSRFPELTESYAKQQRQDCDKAIEAMLLSTGINNLHVVVGKWEPQRIISSSASKIDPKRLLELGVSASVIKQATVEGKPYSYVLVKEINDRR